MCVKTSDREMKLHDKWATETLAYNQMFILQLKMLDKRTGGVYTVKIIKQVI